MYILLILRFDFYFVEMYRTY